VVAATRGPDESSDGERRRKSTASSEACSRGRRFSLDGSSLLQEVEDYDQERVSNIAVCTVITLCCASSLAQDARTQPPGTRTDKIVDDEKAKAKSLSPVEPSHGEQEYDSDSYLVGSTKKWYTGQSTLDFVGLMDNHFEFTAAGAYQNAASMPYYGQGPDSTKDNRSDFRREFTSVHLGGQFHLLDQKLPTGYSVGGLLVHVDPGDLGG
jgi:hypothetical protein